MCTCFCCLKAGRVLYTFSKLYFLVGKFTAEPEIV